MYAATIQITSNTAETQLVADAGLIPDTQIRIYADAAHSFLFHYPSEVVADINEFLASDQRKARS